MKLFFLALLSIVVFSTSAAIAAPEDISIEFFAGEKIIETKALVKGEYDMEYCAIIPPEATSFKLKSKNGTSSDEVIHLEALKKESRCLELPFFFGTVAVESSEISLIPWVTW